MDNILREFKGSMTMFLRKNINIMLRVDRYLSGFTVVIGVVIIISNADI